MLTDNAACITGAPFTNLTGIHGGTSASCSHNTLRTIAANANARAAAKIYLQQVWARPNMVNPPGTANIDPRRRPALRCGWGPER